jgi:hypothetical protein
LGYRQGMKYSPRINWKRELKKLPRGLTFTEVATRLGSSHSTAFYAIKRCGYRASDGRIFAQRSRRRLDPDKVDWKLSNIQIARSLGISKQRVSLVRKKLGKRPVESRGRPRLVEK